MRGCRRVSEAKTFDGLLKFFTENLIIVPDDVFGRGVKIKRLAELLNRPFRKGLVSYIPMQDSPSVVRDSDKDINGFKENGSYHQEINGNRMFGVVLQKRPPSLTFISIGFRLAQIFEYCPLQKTI